MMDSSFLAILRHRGARITPLRLALIAVFTASSKPLTILELKAKLLPKKLRPNVTSIYREVAFLLKNDFVRSVQLAGDKTHYEHVHGHHHHIVCRKCGVIRDVAFPELEKIFPLVEEKLRRLKTFESIDHSLEFFGLCAKCA